MNDVIAAYYQLWDVESNNLIEEYDSLDTMVDDILWCGYDPETIFMIGYDADHYIVHCIIGGDEVGALLATPLVAAPLPR